MNKELTDIVVILDRSGSMRSVRDDTIGGFNTFLDEQKKVDGRARLTLTQFDDEYEIVYQRMDIDEVPALDNKTFIPRGSTALLDAIGRTIGSMCERVEADAPAERADTVVFVIITDGYENASREFTHPQVLEMIRRHEKEDKWEFLYLGANQDAIQEAATIGISADKAASWSKGRAVYRVYSDKLAARRRHKKVLAFDAEDRRRLNEDDDADDNKSETIDPSKLN